MILISVCQLIARICAYLCAVDGDNDIFGNTESLNEIKTSFVFVLRFDCVQTSYSSTSPHTECASYHSLCVSFPQYFIFPLLRKTSVFVHWKVHI